MNDPAHDATDKLIDDMTDKVSEVYRQAANEVNDKLIDYWRRLIVKDEKWQIMVANGQKTEEEYKAWRQSQLMAGKRWEDMKNALAEDYTNADKIAHSIINGFQPEVYAINHNFGTYEIEHAGNLDTSYILYNRESVERLMRDDPKLIPGIKDVDMDEDLRYHIRKLQSSTMQGILQGESIPNMAQRISRDLAMSDYKAAVRYARTATTSAENAGRDDAYHRMDDMGINVMREWRAVFDNRTRHEHRLLDGQKRAVGEPFEVDGYEIMYPGDPDAEPEMVWNCRCSIRGAYAGLEPQARKYRSSAAVNGMSYDQWKEAKPVSRDIEYQTRVGEAIRGSYINQYKSVKDGDDDGA